MNWLKQLRLRLGLAQAPHFSSEEWLAVESTLPFLDWLNDDERSRLRTLASDFLADKEFWGAHELELSNPMLMSIALQACLPILNLGLSAYRGWVGVVVYPGEFLVRRSEMDEAGVVHEYEANLTGEAWEGGPVVLSWQGGADDPDAGYNVVIHEFAHKLDMENGDVDGFPALRTDMSADDWADAFAPAYDALCDALEAGQEPSIDPYAAESPAEFFAVCAEYFFTAPDHLEAAYPAVYQQLTTYFRMNPLASLQHHA